MNRKKLSYVFIIALLALIVSMGYAAAPNQLPLGVRPLGMAEAFVAVADDVNAVAWNPAGLIQLRDRTMNAMYSDLYGIGLKHSYLSGVWPFTDRHVIGADWSHLGFSDDELGIRDDRFSLSYGFRLIHQLSLGANLRYVNIDAVLDGIPLGNASGFGIDTALYFKPIPDLSLGVLGQDLTNTKVKLKSGKRAKIAPRRFRAGVAYRPMDDAMVALDVDDRIHLGLEKGFGGILALRGGIAMDMGSFHLPDSGKTFRESMSFAMGGSIKYSVFQLDYAYLNSPTLPDTHRFGMTFAFGESKPLLSIEEPIPLADVLASFYPLYAMASPQVGEVTLVSSHTQPMPFTLSIFIPGYMGKPAIVARDEIPAAEPGKVSEKTVSLALTLNQKILSLVEDDVDDVDAVITVTYRHKWERQVSKTKTIRLRAMGWVAYRERLDPMVAFIDPSDPVVQKSANDAVKTELDVTEPAFAGMQSTGDNIIKAMQVFEVLNDQGIRYVEDPYTPFQSIYGRNMVGQSDQNTPQTPFQYIELNGPFKRTLYPREIISGGKKTGDCDDLSILYASLLEALGIRTQLLDLGSRVFVMFDSGLQEDNIRVSNLDESRFIKDSGIFWVPVETTMFGNMFAEAWRKGVEACAENQDVLRFVDVHTAWKTYPPMYPITPQTSMTKISGEKSRRIRQHLRYIKEKI